MQPMRSVSALGISFVLALWGVSGTARADVTDEESPSVLGFSPANGATGVCVDTPLSLTFDRAPRIGSSGTISVYRADGTLADSINLADPNSAKRSIGGARLGNVPYAWNYHPILVTAPSATIYL